MRPVSLRQSRFAVARSIGATSPISTRIGREAASQKSRKSSPVGDDRAVCRTDWGGKGRASGIDLRSSLSSIITVRDGQITKFEFFFDHAQALEAVGLRE